MRGEGALELPADLAVAAQKKDRHGSFWDESGYGRQYAIFGGRLCEMERIIYPSPLSQRPTRSQSHGHFHQDA